jgi:hypothetical protein
VEQKLGLRRNPDFDQHDPPADGGVDPASIIAG